MNPLDIEEYQIFLDTIKQTMPLHTENSAVIPNTPFGYLPKNLMDYSAKKMESFIDNNLAVIDEIKHRDEKNMTPVYFLNYYVRFFKKYELLKGDNLYQTRLRDGYRLGLNPNFTEIRSVGFFPFAAMASFSNPVLNRNSHVNGADIELGTGGTAGDFSDTGKLYAFGTGTGVAGQYYDRVAADISTAAGSYVIGIYDESGGNPTNRLADSGPQTASVAFAWVNVTEFALTTNNVWFIWANDNSSNRLQYMTTGGTAHTASYTKFNTLPNPIGTLTSAGTIRGHLKVGHS